MKRALLATALMVATSVSTAPASDPGSCGRSYTGTASCTFASNGLPLVYFGNAQVDSGQASVRVTVTLDGYPDVVLSKCSMTDDRFAQCDNGVPDQTTDPDDFPHQVTRMRLRCTVEGVARGTYGCKAGLG